jgi:hypothetical protein
MITISIEDRLRGIFFSGISFEGVEFVDEFSDADFSFKKVDFSEYDINDIKCNQISFVNGVRRNINRAEIRIREGFNIDNRISPRPNFRSFCFSCNDFYDIPYMIQIPCGPEFGDNNIIENKKYNSKVFWSGRIFTHETRKDVFEFYDAVDDNRFEILNFNENAYQLGLKEGTYERYIDNLSKSDIVYILRGDRPWVNTFFDVIRTGCIPVMISSMNYYGWENIFENVDDYMLRFDLREHSMGYIHEQVVILLEDKERVLRMKANIANFYNTFFKHSSSFGFSEFLLAKCIEIYKSDFDLERVDDKFICSELLTLKGFNNKL